MATAKVPGGAYLAADKKTWHDANGNVIVDPTAQAEPAPDAVHAEAVLPPAAETPKAGPQKAEGSKGKKAEGSKGKKAEGSKAEG